MQDEEQWQLYDEQGRQTAGKGATKDVVFGRGLLHAASHVWIWRRTAQSAEVLVQQRASTKRTWPNLFDVSAAGHLKLGEEPVAAALREIREEIGLDTTETDLRLINVDRRLIPVSTDIIENEFCWVYLLELRQAVEFILQKDEVASLQWKDLSEFAVETRGSANVRYVPQGAPYFARVVAGIEAALS